MKDRIEKTMEHSFIELHESLEQTLTDSMKELFRNHMEDLQQGSGTTGSGENVISNPSDACYTRPTRIDFPMFNGENVKDWIFQCEVLFTIDHTPPKTKTKLAIMHLEGRALKWYNALNRNQRNRVLPDWLEFTRALTEIFGEVCDGPMAALMKLGQKSSVTEYHKEFDAIATRLELSEDYLLSCFLGGLRTEVQMMVRMFQPQSVRKAFSLAKLYETTNAEGNSLRSQGLGSNKSAKDGKSMLGPGPRPQVTTPTEGFKPRYNRILTAAMSYRMTSSAFTKFKTLLNKYMLRDKFVKGSYDRVFKSLDLESGDFVAIKQVSLNDDCYLNTVNMFHRGIDLLKNLNHKNIVKCLGSLKRKNDIYLIFEYVENGSLANIIKPNKFGPLPELLVAVYIAQVLEGLVYLHEQGVIHGDIRGANIRTTKEGLVKLTDFGVISELTHSDINSLVNNGTPYWTAPEVIKVGCRCAASDIWSVGCTVIELLTCVPPYYDLHPYRVIIPILKDERPPIPDSLSPDITDFLHCCFQKDATQRPDARTLLSHPWIKKCRH